MYNGPRRYIFSGSLTEKMVEYLLQVPGFEPIDALVSQLDRYGIEKTLQYMERGVIKSLFIDSGAYSEHSQGIKIDVEEYIDFVNDLDDKIFAIAQVDHIPGVFRKPKTPQDYIESTELSWENFLYMYPKLKSPEKLIAVMHQGESFDYLTKLLEWKDDQGRPMQYIGISPSNDRGVNEKDEYLKQIYSHIARSCNPDVKTHLFGYTSLQGLEKFPWGSVDSTSHRLRPAFAKIFIAEWGTISLSRTREVTSKNDKMFLEIADKGHIDHLTKIIEGYGLTVEQVINESAARTVVDIMEIQKYLKMHPYKSGNLSRTRRLFKID